MNLLLPFVLLCVYFNNLPLLLSRPYRRSIFALNRSGVFRVCRYLLSTVRIYCYIFIIIPIILLQINRSYIWFITCKGLLYLNYQDYHRQFWWKKTAFTEQISHAWNRWISRREEIHFFKTKFLEDTSPFRGATDTPCFGLLVMSVLDFNASPFVCFLACMTLRFTSGATHADCIEFIMATEPFQSRSRFGNKILDPDPNFKKLEL